MTVRQVLVHKGGGVHAIHPEATVLDALRKLAEHDIGALLVMEGSGFSASSPSGTTPASSSSWGASPRTPRCGR